ncbi:hypothetical protein JHK82_047797 [Glycine max]|nr:hypothetical protein JHK82_047797 [Glycine max]
MRSSQKRSDPRNNDVEEDFLLEHRQALIHEPVHEHQHLECHAGYAGYPWSNSPPLAPATPPTTSFMPPVAHASASEVSSVPWTEEEHRLFLLGLHKVGKGDWRGISRNFVKTRTPTQVASHAQKYFLRRHNQNRRRRRSSLFDITIGKEGGRREGGGKNNDRCE